MERRGAIASLIAGIAGTMAAQRASADAPSPQKVVYHLSDANKVGFVLGNIRNHFEGTGGASHVTLALVVHGPPLQSFRADALNPDIKEETARLKEAGLRLFACINTLKGMHLTLGDLVPGFDLADKGGVVKLAELQGQGYAYLRP